jgi:hypothetical protein
VGLELLCRGVALDPEDRIVDIAAGTRSAAVVTSRDVEFAFRPESVRAAPADTLRWDVGAVGHWLAKETGVQGGEAVLVAAGRVLAPTETLEAAGLVAPARVAVHFRSRAYHPADQTAEVAVRRKLSVVVWIDGKSLTEPRTFAVNKETKFEELARLVRSQVRQLGATVSFVVRGPRGKELCAIDQVIDAKLDGRIVAVVHSEVELPEDEEKLFRWLCGSEEGKDVLRPQGKLGDRYASWIKNQ